MMEFCISCGFLLPLDLVGKSFCQPCERERHESTRANRVCRCVICGPVRSSPPRCSDTPTFPFSDYEAEANKPPTRSKTETKNSSRRKKARRGSVSAQADTQHKMQDSNDDQVVTEMDISSTPNWEPTGTAMTRDDPPVVTPITRDDCWNWGQDAFASTADWASASDWSQPQPQLQESENCLEAPLIDESFFVDTQENNDTSDWTAVGKKPSHNPLFGNHDFPVLERGLRENAVLQSVRDDWERQQNEYKQRLVMRDTPDISLAVLGHRRKYKNRRYHVGGVDISFIKGNTLACACLSVVRMPDLELVYQRMEMIQMSQPYIPGFLAFREVPPLSDLFETLKSEAPQYIPDVIMVDGNGILHPRGFGLASQLGVILDIPTIGVAKTLMTAQGIEDDSEHRAKKKTLSEAGEGFDLISDAGQVLGKCVRVSDNAPNPVYVSVGHKISLKSAVWLVLECSKFRIPEPVRRADLDSREYIRQGKTDPEVFIMR